MSDLGMIIELDPSSCNSSVTGSSNDELKSSFFPNNDSKNFFEVKSESEENSFHRHRYKYLFITFI